MRRASEASTRLLLLQLSRQLPFSRSQRLHQAACSSSSSPHSTDDERSKSDGRRESDGKDGHQDRSSSHWLDRRAPAAAEWLDSQARELWLRGLEERCSRVPELTGHELLLRRIVSERAEALARKLSRRFPLDERRERGSDGSGDGEPAEGRTPPPVPTSRVRTHLRAAALVRATGDALLPFFRGDETRVLEVLRDATGGRASGFLAAALRLQARAAPLLAALVPSWPPLSRALLLPRGAGEGEGMAEERLRLLRDDHGGAWPGAEVVVVAEGEEEGTAAAAKAAAAAEQGRAKSFSFASLVPSLLRGGSGPLSRGEEDGMVRLKTTTTTLRVPRCLYYEMMTMASDGCGGGNDDDGRGSGSNNSSSPSRRPRWLEACCCSVDGVWFEPWKSSDSSGSGGGDGPSLSALAARSGSLREPLVSFRRRRWLGESGGEGGGAACELCVTRVEAVQSRRERL